VTLQADLTAKSEEVAAKRAALKALYDGANDVTGTKRAELTEQITTANKELNALVDELGPLQELVAGEERNREALKAMRQPVGRQVVPTNEEPSDEDEDVLAVGYKSVRALLRDSESYQAAIKSGRKFRGVIGDLAVKTLITSADLTPQADRLARIFPSAQEERTIADLMLQGTTNAQRIEYYEETTFTNAAAAVAEGDLKDESALDFTLRQDDVRKIATWIPVTDEMLADVPAFESYLRERLGFMIRREEEDQLLNGNGTAPNIQGILNRTGVQTVTGLGQSTIDSIYQAITEVRVDAFAEPTAGVFHPRDWFDIRTSKDANENYLLGPANTEGDLRVWGLDIRLTTAMTENTGLVGAFRPHAQVYRRSGIEIAISTENEDYFLKNKVAVRAEERLALAVYRPAAFCKVEGLVVGS
jgi:HK97 family phage major capsid protein